MDGRAGVGWPALTTPARAGRQVRQLARMSRRRRRVFMGGPQHENVQTAENRLLDNPPSRLLENDEATSWRRPPCPTVRATGPAGAAGPLPAVGSSRLGTRLPEEARLVGVGVALVAVLVVLVAVLAPRHALPAGAAGAAVAAAAAAPAVAAAARRPAAAGGADDGHPHPQPEEH